MRILVLEISKSESEGAILQEFMGLLSEKTGVQAIDLLQESEERGITAPQVLTFSDLEIRIKEQAVYKGGIHIPMSHYEFFTLCYLAKHPGWVFTKQQIYEAVWGELEGNGMAAVTNIVSQIRKKLNPDDPTHGFIQTVVNSGYKFVA